MAAGAAWLLHIYLDNKSILPQSVYHRDLSTIPLHFACLKIYDFHEKRTCDVLAEAEAEIL
jgi:hypothetical protein